MIICRLQHICSMELKVVIQLHLAIFDIVHIGTYFIHSIAGINGHCIINAWIAEDAINQVDGLIATIATEDAVFAHSLHFGYLLFQCLLQWIWITVDRSVIWILVGIKEYAGIHPTVFITCTRVWCQIPNVLPNKLFKVELLVGKLFLLKRRALQPYSNSILVRIQLFVCRHYLNGLTDMANALSRKFLIGNLATKAIEVHTIISFRIAISRQGVVGTRCIVTCTLASIFTQEHRPCIYHTFDQCVIVLCLNNQMLRSIFVHHLNGFIHIVHLYQLTVAQRLLGNLLARQCF